METVPHPAQEGTSLSDRDTGVPLEVHNAPQCTAVNDILARVGDKWSVRVVMGLADGSRRFNELRRDIPGISQRMLTRTLRGLERDGLVSRTVTPSVPPRVDYALTALGRSSQRFFPLPNTYELFGLDFLVDDTGKVWILEANPEPSMGMFGKTRACVEGEDVLGKNGREVGKGDDGW